MKRSISVIGLFLCALLSPVVLWALPPFESFFAELKKCPFTASAGFYETGSQKVLTLPGGVTVLYSPAENSLVSTLAKYSVDHLLNGGKCLSIQPPPPPNDPPPPSDPQPPSNPSPPPSNPPLEIPSNWSENLYGANRFPGSVYQPEGCVLIRLIKIPLMGPKGGRANGYIKVGTNGTPDKRVGHCDVITHPTQSDANCTLSLEVSSEESYQVWIDSDLGTDIEGWYEKNHYSC